MAFAALSELPEFKKRLDCRDFFQKAALRIVIPFKSERLLAKIHLYYRVNFLKETIFPNIDGAIQQTLTCICINTMIELLKEMYSNVGYLQKVIDVAAGSPEV